MNTLLVDIGNTRVKSALLRGTRLSHGKAVPHGGRTTSLRALVRQAPRNLHAVVAVCVAGRNMERALAAAVQARFGLRVAFVRSARAAAGVRNAYRDTWRLGADRWVAIIAGHAVARRRPVLVANIGTALTLDAVSGDGRHLGGAIAPGPSTMISSLLTGTRGIRVRARGARRAAGNTRRASAGRLFATDTASALDAGAAYAAAALIDRAVAEARAALGMRPLLLLTGGGAAQLRTYIRGPVRVVPDLVLQGLAVLARGRA
jgi:type III pantothenate kinase